MGQTATNWQGPKLLHTPKAFYQLTYSIIRWSQTFSEGWQTNTALQKTMSDIVETCPSLLRVLCLVAHVNEQTFFQIFLSMAMQKADLRGEPSRPWQSLDVKFGQLATAI